MIHLFIRTALLVFCVFSRDISVSAGSNQYWKEGDYSVYEVVDGDTFKVRIKEKIESVRVLGLDTPEKFPTRTGYEECYGKEASKNASKLLYRKTVRLVPDSTQGYRDKYHRILAHVYLQDGVLFSAKMIEEGYGFHYVYGKKPTTEDSKLLSAEKQAKGAKIGVWKVCDGVRKKVDTLLDISNKDNSPYNSYQKFVYPSRVFDLSKNPLQTHFLKECSSKKRYCRQMNSCEEAKFHLLACQVQSLDSDEDQIPCESICK